MRKWTPLTAVCLGTLMLLVDVTIVNVALPDIASDLSASFADLQWVIDIYALVLAALLLATGSLADAWGRRRIYVYGLVIFAVSSLVCGLAQNATELVIARGVQGVGGLGVHRRRGRMRDRRADQAGEKLLMVDSRYCRAQSHGIMPV